MCENVPTNVAETVELGSDGAVVNWMEPTCSDASGTAVVTARSQTPFSFFTVGTTIVTYTCTDASGNTESCSFPVTVIAGKYLHAIEFISTHLFFSLTT